MKQILTVFFFLILFNSCKNEKIVVDQIVDIPGETWEYNKIPDFLVEVKNPNLTHKIYLKLRISREYPYENLYILSHIRDSDGKNTSTQHNLKLMNNEGFPSGSTSGNNISYEMVLFEELAFKKPGNHFIAIEQNMRDSLLFGVKNIGIKIVEGHPVF